MARIAISDAAEFGRGDGAPLLGQLFGHWLVVGEGAIDVDFVGQGEAVGWAEVGKRIVGRRLGAPGEDANESGHVRGLCLAAAFMDVDRVPYLDRFGDLTRNPEMQAPVARHLGSSGLLYTHSLCPALRGFRERRHRDPLLKVIRCSSLYSVRAIQKTRYRQKRRGNPHSAADLPVSESSHDSIAQLESTKSFSRAR
jgi:hypothetical protein